MDVDLLIVIPAYNEELAIEKTISNLKFHTEYWEFTYRIVVIDDGSKDTTAAVAKSNGVEVIRLAQNTGISNVFILASQVAVGINAQRLLIIDADNQHPAEAIKDLYALSDENSLVIGSRNFQNYEMSQVRRWAIRTLNCLTYLKTNLEISDSTSGFRIIGLNPLRYILEVGELDNYLEDTVLIVCLVARAGYKIKEINVNMVPRTLGAPSVQGFTLALKFLSIFLLIVFL